MKHNYNGVLKLPADKLEDLRDLKDFVTDAGKEWLEELLQIQESLADPMEGNSDEEEPSEADADHHYETNLDYADVVCV